MSDEMIEVVDVAMTLELDRAVELAEILDGAGPGWLPLAQAIRRAVIDKDPGRRYTHADWPEWPGGE